MLAERRESIEHLIAAWFSSPCVEANASSPVCIRSEAGWLTVSWAKLN